MCSRQKHWMLSVPWQNWLTWQKPTRNSLSCLESLKSQTGNAGGPVVMTVLQMGSLHTQLHIRVPHPARQMALDHRRCTWLQPCLGLSAHQISLNASFINGHSSCRSNE